MRKAFAGLLFLLLLLISFELLPVVYAEEAKFETFYYVTYAAREDGRTRVTQDITLKNLTQNYYAPQYTLTIGTAAVEDVSAQDEMGIMDIEVLVDEDSNQTNITINMNREVVGEGRATNWTVSYTTLDTAVKNGQVWEVNIPRVVQKDSIAKISRYDVVLQIPDAFGPELFVVPYSPADLSGKIREYRFTKEEIESGGVSATFGEYQVFALDLTYHLKNNNRWYSTQEIALPPDIWGYQKMIYTQIEPPPSEIFTDRDGNYIATYKLKGKEQKDIQLKGFAKLYSRSIDLRNSASADKILSEHKENFTKEQPYWPVNNPQIQKLAQSLTNKENTVGENAYQIYNYVKDTLKYSQQRAEQEDIDRLGALRAIQYPNDAVCTEFTDLFITLARASGIPAKEIDGYAYTADTVTKPLSVRLGSSDVLHSWAQFYDPGLGWVSVDPTWASTTNGLNYFNKLDTNHLAFVIKGLDSQRPYPAGSYKTDTTRQNNDIKVGFAKKEEIVDEKISLEADLDIPKRVIAGFTFPITLDLANTGNVTVFNPNMGIIGQEFTKDRRGIYYQSLPPWAVTSQHLKIKAPLVWRRKKTTLSAELHYEDFQGKPHQEYLQEDVTVIPFFLSWPFWTIGISSGIALYVIYRYYKYLPLFPLSLTALLRRRPPVPGR